MLHILRDKLVRLGKGEDGVALIVTLALFMFMYLSCAGVFSVGRLVKNRIHLQNACDAAAYSAAVVQADTLSRIATINRAMAWTYVSMTHRQIDYIINKWLEKSCKEYAADIEKAEAIGSDPWKPDASMLINKSHANSFFEAVFDCANFISHTTGGSFYSDPGNLHDQIVSDKETIKKMNDAEVSLLENLRGRIEKAVDGILVANVPQGIRDNCFRLFVYDKGKGGGQLPSYVALARSEGYSEQMFAQLADCTLDVSDVDGAEWFTFLESDPEGFLRSYKKDVVPLRSDWWWAPKGSPDPLPMPNDNHVDADDLWDFCYNVGERARPYVLNASYFGNAGTITVGLACRNENPWYSTFKGSASIANGILSGIYGAFNPYKDVDWTWVFSSAKAGYKFKDDSLEGRDYMVHWDEDRKDWNLCQSDWDAVFVPVRQAAYAAKATGSKGNSKWSDKGEKSELEDWITKGSWKSLGGSASPYVVADMANLPGMHDGSGAIKNLNWRRLADMLYH